MDITLYACRIPASEPQNPAQESYPLILLHGNGEDSSYFANQMQALGAHREIIAIDTRGHGKSPRGTEPFTLAQFSDDLLDFMDENNISQADILGFSDGGNIALIFALTHPDRVHKLILNGANLNPRGLKLRVLLPIVLQYRLNQDPATKELLALMVNEPHIPLSALESLNVETLVIAGTHDMIKESHTKAIAHALPHATLALIEGDHFIAAKCPDTFNQCVLAFLES